MKWFVLLNLLKILFLFTCIEQKAAMTPSTGDSENGSKYLSERRKKSGFNKNLI